MGGCAHQENTSHLEEEGGPFLPRLLRRREKAAGSATPTLLTDGGAEVGLPSSSPATLGLTGHKGQGSPCEAAVLGTDRLLVVLPGHGVLPSSQSPRIAGAELFINPKGGLSQLLSVLVDTGSCLGLSLRTLTAAPTTGIHGLSQS